MPKDLAIDFNIKTASITIQLILMQKQRSASRPELHLVQVNRNGQRVLHRLESAHSIQSQYVMPMHQPIRIQQQIQIPYQQPAQTAPNKRVEISYCKQNIPVHKQYNVTTTHQPTSKSHHMYEVRSENPQQSFPIRHQISAPLAHKVIPTAHRPQTIAEKDRALTDIGNNMFNSAIFPSYRPQNDESMKNRWTHNTPDMEICEKYNRQPTVMSSLFDTRSNQEVRPNSAVSLDLSEGESRELSQREFVRVDQAAGSKNIKVVDASFEYGLSRHPISPHQSMIQSPASTSLKSSTVILSPAIDQRFKQLDELAQKLKTVEEAVARLQQNNSQKNHLTIPYTQKEGRLSQKTVDTDTGSEQEIVHQPPLQLIKKKSSKLAFSINSQNEPKTYTEQKINIPVNRSLQVREPSFEFVNTVQFSKEQEYVASPVPRQRSIEHNKLNFFKKKPSIYEPQSNQSKASQPLTTPVKSPSISGVQIISSPRLNPFQEPQQPSLSLSDFHVGKKLGKGKFGEVFLVTHKVTGFICAMKVMSKQSIREQKLLTQLTRELKILSFVKHPNLISCYGFFSDSDNVYVLLELCSGGHLYKQLQEKRRFQEEDAAILMKQICEGVKYLHELQILHRDIKPENIILENGIAKICDFGWSVFSWGLRKTVCGTPLYLSPQILKGQEYDEKIDLWAIGILTYELIIGKIPFKIWNEAQLNKIVNDQVTFPDYVKISDKAKDFILRILEKDPTKRLSIDELLAHPFLQSVDNVNASTLLQ